MNERVRARTHTHTENGWMEKLIYPIDRKPINFANNEILFTQL